MVRGVSLLKQSEQRHHSRGDDPQITRAREEAEALFRPKLKIIEGSAPTDAAPIASSTRRPRVLSVSVSPAGRPSSESKIGPPVSVSQITRIQQERRRLRSDRAAIFHQQHQLRAKLDAIDGEMRAIDAYETVRNGKSPIEPRRSR